MWFQLLLAWGHIVFTRSNDPNNRTYLTRIEASTCSFPRFLQPISTRIHHSFRGSTVVYAFLHAAPYEGIPHYGSGIYPFHLRPNFIGWTSSMTHFQGTSKRHEGFVTITRSLFDRSHPKLIDCAISVWWWIYWLFDLESSSEWKS